MTMLSNKNWKADSHSAIVNLCLIEDTKVQAALQVWEDGASIAVIDAGHVRYIPFLYRRILDLNLQSRNRKILMIFKGVYLKTSWQQMVFQKRNIEFLASKQSEMPEFAFLKGVALQNSVYVNDPRTRPCDDVDILVDRTDLDNAITFLCEQGFQLEGPYSMEYVLNFRKSASFTKGNVSIDLNWGLYDYARGNKYTSDLQFEKVYVDGDAFLILSDTFNLIHSMLHGAGWNSTPSTRWILDAALLIRTGSIDWNVFEKVVIENGWQYPLILQLDYLAEFDVFIPIGTKNKIRSSKRDWLGIAMYFYLSRSSLLARRFTRLLYGDYLAYITNQRLEHSIWTFIRFEFLVLCSLTREYLASLKRRLNPSGVQTTSISHKTQKL